MARLLSGPLDAGRVLPRFITSLFSNRINAVHVCTSGSYGLARDALICLMSRLRCPRVILHMRFGRIPNVIVACGWESMLLRIACRIASHVIVLDRESAAALTRELPGCTVSVIPNPAWGSLDSEEYAEPETAVPVLLFAGHVTPAKGIRELVNACCALRKFPFRLELAGPIQSDFREELIALASRREKGEWLGILGPLSRDEVLARMKACFAVVLPSHTEGFPNVILEAMSLGKPIIATAVGAVPEMLADGDAARCGVCVPVGDADALRARIEELLADPAAAAGLGRRARERALQVYNPLAVFAQYQLVWSPGLQESRTWERATS